MVQAPSVLVDKKFWEFKGGPNEVSISSFVNNLHCKGRESIEKLLTQCNTQLQNSSTQTGARIYNVLPMSQLGSVPAKHRVSVSPIPNSCMHKKLNELAIQLLLYQTAS